MDIPGFHLDKYAGMRPELRPVLDLDLIENLAALIEDGGRVPSKRARTKLFRHVEDARLERDLGLSGSLRRRVRQWEAINVDDDDTNTPRPAKRAAGFTREEK